MGGKVRIPDLHNLVSKPNYERKADIELSSKEAASPTLQALGVY